jgi:UDP-N-acetyl-D-mannosaminuronate dehydrogenase
MLTLSAAEIVGLHLKKGVSVVPEKSTIYPGVTEEIIAPILESASGLKCGADFYIGYSPERLRCQ